MAMRVGVTIVSACRSPLDCVRSIPKNWWRNIACVDVTHWPEPFRGLDSLDKIPVVHEDAAFLHPRRLLQFVRESLHESGVVVGVLAIALVAVPFSVFVALPAWLYRWASKGTFLPYSPLVWIAHRSFASGPWNLLHDIREVAFHRLVRGYSVVVLAALAARGALDLVSPTWPSIWAHHPSARYFEAVFAPGHLPLWQIAMGLNAVLAWALYYFADWVLVRQKRRSTLNEHWLGSILRSVWLVRGAASIFVILNGIWTAAVFAGVLPTWVHKLGL